MLNFLRGKTRVRLKKKNNLKTEIIKKTDKERRGMVRCREKKLNSSDEHLNRSDKLKPAKKRNHCVI
jgi:hypothetical protein